MLNEDLVFSELAKSQNKDLLLYNIIQALQKRGENSKALDIINRFSALSSIQDFNFYLYAQVYIDSEDSETALGIIVEGLKLIKDITSEQFGGLFPLLVQINGCSTKPKQSEEIVDNDCFVKIRDQERWYYVGDDAGLDATKIDSRNRKYSAFIGKKTGDVVGFPEDKYSSKPKRVIETIAKIELYIHINAAHHFYRLSEEGRWDSGWVVEVPPKGDSVDLSNLFSFLEDMNKPKIELFETYNKSLHIPLAILIASEGDLPKAINRIISEEKGFIKFSDGSLKHLEEQKKNAERLLDGAIGYLDLTSAFFLSELGLLKTVLNSCKELYIPQSVVNFFFKLKKELIKTPGKVGYLGFHKGRLKYSALDENPSQILDKLDEDIKTLESNDKRIVVISDANKSQSLMEDRIPSEAIDASILAQKQQAIILTDDYLYLIADSHFYNKKVSAHCSTFAIIKILLERELISFEKYLDYFYYLSFYRGRFLSFDSNDLFDSVFIQGQITRVIPDNLKKFNLDLVLSKEYGVTDETALKVVLGFICRILFDNSVTIELAEKIFNEVIPPFLKSRKDRLSTANLLLKVCIENVKSNQKQITSDLKSVEKLEALERIIDIYLSAISITH